MDTTFEYDREKLEIYDEDSQSDLCDYRENVSLYFKPYQVSTIQEIIRLSNWEAEIKSEMKGHC